MGVCTCICVCGFVCGVDSCGISPLSCESLLSPYTAFPVSSSSAHSRSALYMLINPFNTRSSSSLVSAPAYMLLWIFVGHSAIVQLVDGASPKHRDASLKHRDASPKHRDASPKHRDASPKHRDASPKRRDVSPKRRDVYPKRLDESPKRLDPKFVGKFPPKGRDASPKRRDADVAGCAE